jgi:hypothetical protein
MNTRAKIMGLAALPLAGLLATGGVAMAQSAGTPARTQVVQQAVTHRAGDPCPEHAATAAAQQARDQLRVRDRDCGTCGDRQHTQTATRTMDQLRLHDGSCDQHADR